PVFPAWIAGVFPSDVPLGFELPHRLRRRRRSLGSPVLSTGICSRSFPTGVRTRSNSRGGERRTVS
ncbi:hypothetical protein A2U01_0095246, partial [Trifolium medium]|nr:hypothetical protein [Trifolium medium]